MAYGLTIYNDNGSLIINEDFANYMLIETGTYANGSLPSGASVSGIYPGTDDMLWVRPHVTGGNYLYFPDRFSYLYSSSGYTEYVRARRHPTPSTDNFGLKVYNSGGTISYDSGRPPLTPVMNYRDTPNESTPLSNTRVNAPFYPVSGRKRFIPYSCMENFILWQLVGSAAHRTASKVIWHDDATFDVTTTSLFVNSNAAGVIYSKPVGALNYFWADFAT